MYSTGLRNFLGWATIGEAVGGTAVGGATLGGGAALARWCLLPILMAAMLSSGSEVWSQDPVDFDALLEAGEFGPARAAALDLGDSAERNRRLGHVARAQFQAGSPQASLATARRISDDRSRGRLLEDFRAAGMGRGGGAALADFDSLIELIQSTIAPSTWDEVGGPGAVEPFPTGVYVDPQGLLGRVGTSSRSAPLASIRRQAGPAGLPGPTSVRSESPLRKVSLTRLEREIQSRWALGRLPTEAMLQLAGLYKIQYVFMYPETGDIVIAGPAGDWTDDVEGRTIHPTTRRPTLQLDDLVVLLRIARQDDSVFGCAIKPRQDNLAATQAFLEKWSDKPVSPTRRDDWLEQLRSTLGKQDIDVFGLDPHTRVARVLVEADYRMKLVGMGLEPGVLGVTSYLKALGNQAPPDNMSVLRWWFTLNYDAILASPRRDAFEIRGQGVRVLSENERLTERGERIHTGQSDEPTAAFARSFTKHFPELASKYPVYADLQNIFDLALVTSLIDAEDLAGQVDWHALHFQDPDRYQIVRGLAPTEVDTVLNHRVIDRRQFVAGVSGGVRVATASYVTAEAVQTDREDSLRYRRAEVPAAVKDSERWWWD